MTRKRAMKLMMGMGFQRNAAARNLDSYLSATGSYENAISMLNIKVVIDSWNNYQNLL